MPYVGIDFGTSNSVVADFRFGRPVVIADPEGRTVTPSVVTLRRDGSISVGQEAKETYDDRRSLRSIKRVLGTPEKVRLAGQEIRLEQAAAMLFSMLKRGAEASLKQPVEKAVVTIPANSKGLARLATKNSAIAGGLQVLALINEPTAAAICYGLNVRQEQYVLVYDFGGGTLDVTVLRVHHGIFEEIGSNGISRLGGDDADELLAQFFADRLYDKTRFDVLDSPHRTAFLLAVEKAKIDLSEMEQTVVRRAALAPERQLDLEEPVTRTEYEALVRPLIERSGKAVREAIAVSGVPRDRIDKVLLVGGMSKTPLVRQYVRDLVGIEPEPFTKADPLTCVAQGAAIVSAILQGAPGVEHLAYSVKLEHSLCVCAWDERGNAFLDPIVRRGSAIPCSYARTYYPVADPAESIAISVYEGDVYSEPDNPDNVRLAELPWHYDPPRKQQNANIEVTYNYGDDGILSVTILDPHARLSTTATIEPTEALGPDFAKRAKKVNDKLLDRTAIYEATEAHRKALEMLRRAEQIVLPRVTSAEERMAIDHLCRQLRQANGYGDSAKVLKTAEQLAERLLDYAHLL